MNKEKFEKFLLNASKLDDGIYVYLDTCKIQLDPTEIKTMADKYNLVVVLKERIGIPGLFSAIKYYEFSKRLITAQVGKDEKN